MLQVLAVLEVEKGLIANKKLVWKIMRELGLKGLPGPSSGPTLRKEFGDLRSSTHIRAALS
jgi:hypothetical protein